MEVRVKLHEVRTFAGVLGLGIVAVKQGQTQIHDEVGGLLRDARDVLTGGLLGRGLVNGLVADQTIPNAATRQGQNDDGKGGQKGYFFHDRLLCSDDGVTFPFVVSKNSPILARN